MKYNNIFGINVLHQQLVHPNEVILNKNSKEIEKILIFELSICELCELDKYRSSNTNKIKHIAIPITFR